METPGLFKLFTVPVLLGVSAPSLPQGMVSCYPMQRLGLPSAPAITHLGGSRDSWGLRRSQRSIFLVALHHQGWRWESWDGRVLVPGFAHGRLQLRGAVRRLWQWMGLCSCSRGREEAALHIAPGVAEKG